MTTYNNIRKLSAWFLTASLTTALYGCSGEIAVGDTLPDGKYPMTFTAQVDGLTVTRATVDGSWSGGEEVAVQIGSEVKKYAAASGGNLTVAGGDPFYWQSKGNITINAWYPYNKTKPTAGALKVQADQNEDANYQASDYLEVVDATVVFANTAELKFKHRTAKVSVTLNTGEGITDISGATVKFVNQVQVEGNGTEVVAKTITTGTYIALLIPQQMQNKQFIKVTIGTNGDARDYYYTPANINLEAGKQYSYTVTVKKEGLTVTAGTSVSWTDNDFGDVEATEETP